MLRHLMKLIWKRKSRNMMLSLEILLAFAVVFGIAAFAVRSDQLYRLPLGYHYANVWSVRLVPGEAQLKADAQLYEAFRRSLHELPEVTQVGFAGYSPFTNSVHTTSFEAPGIRRQVTTHMLPASDDFFAAMDMQLAEGRWFSGIDDGDAAHPVVINRALANALFPAGSALGKQFTDGNTGADRRVMKVTGVVDEYRSKGELTAPVNFMFTRFVPHADPLLRTIVLQVRPGTERAFEARLNRQLRLIRNDWSYEISPLPALRTSMLKAQATPLMILAVVAAFMLAMVAFGLFGVLWQNTTQRIPEIGLRRAVGASATHIYRQIIAEQMLVSSVAIAVALALLVQLPITGVLGASLNWTVFIAAAGLSMFVIYLISLLCSVYPGWRASRLSPTEALHYE
jgi:putative ABC transport system permease protein